jgi:acyl carrier protein|tara:strand:+ start:775 stop:1011 length:237 start_codon:yes stop_codon:yes gene_type:complete
MNNKELYKSCFTISLSISDEGLEDLEYNSVPEWDSIGHMSLISELEEKFKISIDTDDIVDFSSFSKGKEILKKYKVEL